MLVHVGRIYKLIVHYLYLEAYFSCILRSWSFTSYDYLPEGSLLSCPCSIGAISSFCTLSI